MLTAARRLIVAVLTAVFVLGSAPVSTAGQLCVEGGGLPEPLRSVEICVPTLQGPSG
jgi:hypothetical protein